MFFTREDVLKIQQALLQLGVKDSELPNAEPVTYNDILSIVQDGKNKQIGVKDFCNQISLWKREDFINITDKYNEHYISLIKAINLVPILQRKDGLVITFQDVEGNWEIYQFRGNITEFFEEDKWFNLYDYRNNIVQSIVPDEEDLTASTPDENGNSLVSLKDRVYDPTSFSGKGHKILRKNIQLVNIAVTKIKVEFSPSSDGILAFVINGRERHVAVSATIDNTTELVAQKIASALQESMTEYEVSKDASMITLTRKFGGSVTPSVFSASTTGIVCTVTDSTKQELRNILTSVMINQPNTIYEIRYDFDLNALGITMPKDSILKFNGGTIANGVVYSNKTKIINIPKDFNIMGNIYNINGKEITIRGDVLNKKIKILAPSVVYTPKWWKSDFGEDRFMKIARDIGITDFYTLVRIDNTTLPNYQCQPCPEFADAETLANRFLSNGYKEIFGIKFHTESNFNNTESPDKIMPNFINYIVDYVKAVINKGLILHNINIVNEESDWTRKDSEYIDYIVELANRITQLGLTPRISFDSIYNLKLADSKLYNCISPDFNFYPTISFLDRETKYDKDISNELIEGIKNTYNMAWGRYISTFGMSETGICANEKAFRYPWEYRTENLGESMPKAPIIYWEIISDVINILNCPFVNVWFFEGLTKEKNIDVDALYNIFINKIK